MIYTLETVPGGSALLRKGVVVAKIYNRAEAASICDLLNAKEEIVLALRGARPYVEFAYVPAASDGQDVKQKLADLDALITKLEAL